MLPSSTTKMPKAMILFEKIGFDAASIPVSQCMVKVGSLMLDNLMKVDILQLL